VWEIEKCDDTEKALLFYSDREIRRMVRVCIFVCIVLKIEGCVYVYECVFFRSFV
jgi:hypothetical protein